MPASVETTLTNLTSTAVCRPVKSHAFGVWGLSHAGLRKKRNPRNPVTGTKSTA